MPGGRFSDRGQHHGAYHALFKTLLCFANGAKARPLETDRARAKHTGFSERRPCHAIKKRSRYENGQVMKKGPPSGDPYLMS
jgi:hypothetical protein